METMRLELHHLIDVIPDDEIPTVKRFLQFLIREVRVKHEFDEPLNTEDISLSHNGWEEYLKGHVRDWSDIRKEIIETSPWKVFISNSAEKDLKTLTVKEQVNIRKSIDTLKSGPFQEDVKQLEKRPEWSMKIGSHRVIFRVDKSGGAIIIIAICKV